MPFLDVPMIEPASRRTWRLARPMEYEGESETFTVPAGYVTDLASVPRALLWLVPPYGAYTRAAILHDWLITDAIPAGRITSRDTDGLFRRVMREEGVKFVPRWVLWAAVRSAAPFSATRRRGLGLRDYPLVLLIGLTAGVPVLIASALPALLLGALRLVGLAR